jgi:cyclase
MSTSRREFLTTSAAAALGLVASGSLRATRAYAQGQAPQPVFTLVRRDVGTFTMRGGTVGWLANSRAIVVVDTQFPAEARALLDGLRARSNKPVELLINTHHHGDHTSGNPVFRGVAKRVVAHSMADQHMRRAPGTQSQAQPQTQQQPAQAPLYPDTVFTHLWSADVGGERIVARHHGRAHTSGDAVITFERANVVHMGDLMFNRWHPVVDRAAGASMRNWMLVLEQVAAAHSRDTIYIFGHAGRGQPVTGSSAELLRFRDYLGAVLDSVERQVRAGRSREEVLAARQVLQGFEEWGAFGQAGARDPITVAYEEVTAGA